MKNKQDTTKKHVIIGKQHNVMENHDKSWVTVIKSQSFLSNSWYYIGQYPNNNLNTYLLKVILLKFM